ncbi:hypothetical protein RvY_08014 [Ramazzottius varieornatus]|uniref:Uncharacterized protein n=1 Tax=Ramazzottius varieornatus TaxID=947166 RepID=A0A1D1V4A0_RAMVA|nr:hypothetical protein RvY_08014 [Ramazzottius varieornatus]
MYFLPRLLAVFGIKPDSLNLPHLFSLPVRAGVLGHRQKSPDVGEAEDRETNGVRRRLTSHRAPDYRRRVNIQTHLSWILYSDSSCSVDLRHDPRHSNSGRPHIDNALRVVDGSTGLNDEEMLVLESLLDIQEFQKTDHNSGIIVFGKGAELVIMESLTELDTLQESLRRDSSQKLRSYISPSVYYVQEELISICCYLP